MIRLLLIVIAGAGAQLVDGSLGMGYGVTSASLLLATGLAPAMVSTSVNIAQLGTTLTSGISHWRAGNVDGAAVARLAIPGGLGALAGATVLSSLAMGSARPVMSALLLLLGVLVIVRFLARGARPAAPETALPRARALAPLGLIGGFVNATGGGGWGPIVTSTLLTSSSAPPRRVIGTVSASEFVVTVCACIGLLAGLGIAGTPVGAVLALMVGGMLAAPIAAQLAGRLPAAILGVCVGSLIIALNLAEVLEAIGLTGGPAATVRLVTALACLAVIALAVRRVSRGRTREPGSAPTTRAVAPMDRTSLSPGGRAL